MSEPGQVDEATCPHGADIAHGCDRCDILSDGRAHPDPYRHLERWTVSYMLHGRRVDTVWETYRDAAYLADLIDEGELDAYLLGGETR